MNPAARSIPGAEVTLCGGPLLRGEFLASLTIELGLGQIKEEINSNHLLGVALMSGLIGHGNPPKLSGPRETLGVIIAIPWCQGHTLQRLFSLELTQTCMGLSTENILVAPALELLPSLLFEMGLGSKVSQPYNTRAQLTL